MEENTKLPEVKNENTKAKTDYLLPASVLIAALLIAGALVYNVGKKPPANVNNPGVNPNAANTVGLKPSDIDLSGSVLLGEAAAPVTLIEYGDYQCPYCARFFEQTEPQIKTDYIDTGKVKFVYKDLAFLGPESVASAEAAACAQEQGKFWEYHDALFQTEIDEAKTNPRTENSGNLNRNLFLTLAKKLNLDTAAFASCIDSAKYKDKVQKEVTEAGNVLANPSTPAFFVNDKALMGAQPYSAFAQAIEAALRK